VLELLQLKEAIEEVILDLRRSLWRAIEEKGRSA
jgi:hypothetical protein